MDFFNFKDSGEFQLIPEGTVCKAMINKVTVGPGKTDPSKTVMQLELQVSSGEYLYAKVLETITIKSGDLEKDSMNLGRTIKRMLEFFNGANENNRMGYIIPDTTSASGRPETNWNFLLGKEVGFKTKLDSFTSNKTGKLLYSSKIGEYASKNPTSGGYKIWEVIQAGTQPWQKPLPTENKAKESVSGFGLGCDDLPM